jgi:dihydrofolate reductase
MRVSIIVAVAENGVIGRGGALPWHLPDDLKRFKQLTMGHAIVMGRKTWESIGRPLPGRKMIVVTRQADYRPHGVHVAASLDDALHTARAAGDDEAFVIGGAEIYRHALPLADRLYFTRVHAAVEGDTQFPNWDDGNWRLVSREDRAADEKHEFSFSFEFYERQL